MEHSKKWYYNTNIYEVNLRQYTPEGTIKAFAQHLPRLKEMGVETLWFMPVTPISEKNKKGILGSYYACSSYVAVSPEFGTLADFKNLVTEAHALGFKVILDWVANHTGWDHTWTFTHPEYYLKDEHTGDFLAASGMDDIIELDFSNKALRNAMIEAMQFWVTECDIDGFRCDLAFWVELDFWQEARPQLDKIKPLFWLGEYDEIDNPDYGTVFDASYSWRWMHATRGYCEAHRTFNDLLQLLLQYNTLGTATMRAWFTTNHDENSWNGTEYEKYGDLAHVLAVFGNTWTGVPLMYTGQEIPNHKRLAFFEKDEVNWNQPLQLASFYTTLFNLRKNNNALQSGEEINLPQLLQVQHNAPVLAYSRSNGDDQVITILNFSEHHFNHMPVSFGISNELYKNVFTGETYTMDELKTAVLPSKSYLLLEKIKK